MRTPQSVKDVIPRRVRDRAHSRRIALQTRHLVGSRKVTPDPNNYVVTCLVKNGSYYVNTFVRHYLAMGAAHIIVLDNGSSDETVDLFAEFDQVTVYECGLPVGKYQRLMKRYLAQSFVPFGWCLDVDIDELFDYPFSSIMAPAEFLQYLDDCGFDAVVTQMVDMYSAAPISHLADTSTSELKPDDYPFYDFLETEVEAYGSASIVHANAPDNDLSGVDPGIMWGGVRRRLFDLRCLLSKHSLFRVDRGLQLFPHPHFCNRARIADVTGLLRHYKLVSNCYETSLLNHGSFSTTRQGYADLLNLIERKPDMRIYDERFSTLLSTSQQLLATGVLVASTRFQERVLQS